MEVNTSSAPQVQVGYGVQILSPLPSRGAYDTEVRFIEKIEVTTEIFKEKA